MKKIYFLFFIILLGCSAQKSIPISEEDANYTKTIDSEIRSIRFRYLGEGNQVEINFRDPVSGGDLTIDENSLVIQCSDFYRQVGNRLSFDHATFPFIFHMKYKILVLSGTSREPRNCDFDLTINKKGSWRVEVNH